MSLYRRWILPKLVDFTCRSRPAMRQRAKVVPRARGRVVEIGFGTGLNLERYDRRRVERIWAVEPAAEMWRLAEERVAASGLPVDWVEAGAEQVPLPEACADTVLVTYALCTISDPRAALAEVRRLLAPGGELVFCEHGAAPDPGVRRWQERLDPLWTRLAGGCHLNRDIAATIEGAGFRALDVETMYLPGWRPATFNTWGAARPI